MVTRVCPIWMVKITIKSLKSKNGFKCPFRRWVSPFYPLRSLKILKSQSHIVNFSPTDLIFFVRVSGTHILLRRRKKDMLSGQKDRIHSVLKNIHRTLGLNRSNRRPPHRWVSYHCMIMKSILLTRSRNRFKPCYTCPSATISQSRFCISSAEYQKNPDDVCIYA